MKPTVFKFWVRSFWDGSRLSIAVGSRISTRCRPNEIRTVALHCISCRPVVFSTWNWFSIHEIYWNLLCRWFGSGIPQDQLLGFRSVRVPRAREMAPRIIRSVGVFSQQAWDMAPVTLRNRGQVPLPCAHTVIRQSLHYLYHTDRIIYIYIHVYIYI